MHSRATNNKPQVWNVIFHHLVVQVLSFSLLHRRRFGRSPKSAPQKSTEESRAERRRLSVSLGPRSVLSRAHLKIIDFSRGKKMKNYRRRKRSELLLYLNIYTVYPYKNLARRTIVPAAERGPPDERTINRRVDQFFSRVLPHCSTRTHAQRTTRTRNKQKTWPRLRRRLR